MNAEIISELEDLRARANGVLHPASIVDRARNADSALHKLFEWDDGAAAQAYRIQQARGVIRAVISIMPAGNRGPVEVRAYVSLSADRVNGGGYRSIADVQQDDLMLSTAIDDIRRAIQRLQLKFGTLAALRPSLEALTEALGELPAP